MVSWQEPADERCRAAIERFDALNAQDPKGKELPHSRRMTTWLERLAPEASEPLRLAARGQHLMRWRVPRSDFPANRSGYLQWRTKLRDFHADLAAETLREVGYEDATIARVRALIRKQNLKRDPETQLLEDVICLVFLENDLAEFARGHEDEKLRGILRKTWKKMSARGHVEAMTIELGARERQLLRDAM